MRRNTGFAAMGAAAIVLMGIAGCARNAGEANAVNVGQLAQGFQTVPDADKPWCYWWWLKGNVDEKSITSDLEAMKAAGFGGLLMFDARGYHEDHVIPPPSRTDFMSPRWRELLKYSLKEANRLGLSFSINLSSDAGALKGPWPVGDDAPKKLIWTSADLRGPRRVSCQLTKPEGRRFWEVAILAVRHESTAKDIAPSSEPLDLSGQWQDAQAKSVSRTSVETIDLSRNVDAGGKLTWEAPEGQWTLLRFAYTTMDGHEFDVDILDPRAVEGHFDRMGKTILKDAGDLAGKTLTHFYSVSWEGAAPTWTPAMGVEFLAYRGYSMRSWLPALAGFTVRNHAATERFLRDYHKTLGDMFMNNFYGRLRELCHANGLKWHSESGGPWTRTIPDFQYADQLAFLSKNDMPQGEFWFSGRAMNRPAAMTAHIYGKRLAATEAFTHMVQHWSAYPAALKPFADAAFCDGTNQLIWHTFTASPPELGKPGSEYFAGTHINPNVTWFPQAGPFIRYLGRCQYMLRQGHFVADVCCYVGDNPYQHWGHGEQWSEKATMQLAKGYTYDLLTTEVLLDRLAVKDGELVLPDGMRYRALVVDLDQATASPAALRKVIDLAKSGATVILGQRQPEKAPGLSDYPSCDSEVQRLAGQLWNREVNTVTGLTKVDALLSAKGIEPDFDGPFTYTHRRTPDAEIYFLAGSGEADCTFRVSDMAAELWDAVSGRIEPAPSRRATEEGGTIVHISLPENGSTFVVFRKGSIPLAQPETRDAKSDSAPRTLSALAGPWTVEFQPGRGAPRSATFEKLIPWDRHADEGIRHFSGRAVYRTSFNASDEQAKSAARLHLGQVMCIAEVTLNGKPLGIVWTAPWAIDLQGLKPGRNELEIAVTNTWVNRLIGDAALPPEKRITKTNVAYEPGERKLKIYQSFAATDKLMPSGLLGPVAVEFGAQAPATGRPAPRHQ